MKPVHAIDSILKLKGNEVWSVAPEATVFDAMQTMSDKGVGALLAMAEGRLEGIVSERDYARKVILKDRSSKQTRVREIMSGNLVTVTPENTVERCMCLMADYRIRHLPVLDGERVVGVISIRDLVNWIVQAEEQMIDQLVGYIEGKYPG